MRNIFDSLPLMTPFRGKEQARWQLPGSDPRQILGFNPFQRSLPGWN